MTIPDFETLMFPLLEFARNGKIRSVDSVEEHLTKKFNLTPEERKKLKPSGGETTFFNRIRWARLYLKKAKLIEDPKKAHYCITQRGLEVLKRAPKRIDTKFLMQFNEFKEWYTKVQQGDDIARRKKTSQPKRRKGIIVLLDALGTKGIWKKKSHKESVRKWNIFTSKFDQYIRNQLKWLEVSFNSFSDTIVITVTTNKVEKDLFFLASALAFPLIHSMMLGMPLRGCISAGEFIRDEKLIIGKAIDEAAEYYELPQWVGISAAPSTHKIIEKCKISNPTVVKNNFFKCEIPLKKSVEQNAWGLLWADVGDEFAERHSKKLVGKQYNSILQVIKDQTEEASDISSILKWRNTQKFYEMVTEYRDPIQSKFSSNRKLQ